MRLHKIKILFISRLKILFIINLNTKMGILCGFVIYFGFNLGQYKHQIRGNRSMRTKNLLYVILPKCLGMWVFKYDPRSATSYCLIEIMASSTSRASATSHPSCSAITARLPIKVAEVLEAPISAIILSY